MGVGAMYEGLARPPRRLQGGLESYGTMGGWRNHTNPSSTALYPRLHRYRHPYGHALNHNTSHPRTYAPRHIEEPPRSQQLIDLVV